MWQVVSVQIAHALGGVMYACSRLMPMTLAQTCETSSRAVHVTMTVFEDGGLNVAGGVLQPTNMAAQSTTM
jgi:hypothetical protein